jgi:hypothetical protein
MHALLSFHSSVPDVCCLTGAGLLLLLLLLLVLLMALSPAGVSPYFFSMSSDELPSTCN